MDGEPTMIAFVAIAVGSPFVFFGGGIGRVTKTLPPQAVPLPFQGRQEVAGSDLLARAARS